MVSPVATGRCCRPFPALAKFLPEECPQTKLSEMNQRNRQLNSGTMKWLRPIRISKQIDETIPLVKLRIGGDYGQITTMSGNGIPVNDNRYCRSKLTIRLTCRPIRKSKVRYESTTKRKVSLLTWSIKHTTEVSPYLQEVRALVGAHCLRLPLGRT